MGILSFRNKKHRRRIKALKKEGYSGKSARRLARKENTARNGKFGKRLWKGVKKVAPYALGAASIGIGTGLIGAKSIGGLKGIFGKIKAGKAARIAKRATSRSKIGGKTNFFKKIFKNRRLAKRSAVKTVSRIKSRGLTLPKQGLVRSAKTKLKRRSFVKSFKAAENTLQKIRSISPTLDSRRSADLSTIIREEASRANLIRPTSFKTPKEQVVVSDRPAITASLDGGGATQKTTFVGDLFRGLRDKAKQEVQRTTKPQSPTNNKAADALQVAQQIYDKASPFLGSSSKRKIDEEIQNAKDAIVRDEARKKAESGLNFLGNNSWIMVALAAIIGYKLLKKK